MAIYAVKEMGSMQAGYCSIGHGPNIVKCWAMEDILRGSRLVASGDSGERKKKTLLYFHSSMSLQYIDHILQPKRCLAIKSFLTIRNAKIIDIIFKMFKSQKVLIKRS